MSGFDSRYRVRFRRADGGSLRTLSRQGSARHGDKDEGGSRTVSWLRVPRSSLTLEGALFIDLFSTGGFAVPALQHISAASFAAQYFFIDLPREPYPLCCIHAALPQRVQPPFFPYRCFSPLFFPVFFVFSAAAHTLSTPLKRKKKTTEYRVRFDFVNSTRCVNSCDYGYKLFGRSARGSTRTCRR